MGIESGPKIEYTSRREVPIPQEVSEMQKDLVDEARNIFSENHKQVVEAMSLGPRKAKEILESLSNCRVATKNVIRKFGKEKERIYS